MLEMECQAAGVKIFLQSKICEVRHDVLHKARGSFDFVVRTDSIEFRAPTLVVATGGLSIPKVGASALGYDLARQFGLRVVETRPALVPLLLSNEDCARYCDLAGVSAEVNVAIGNQSFHESMLITHRGLSGPAILQVSSYWNNCQPIVVDLAPGREVTAFMRLNKSPRNLPALRSAFQGVLPLRFATRVLDLHPLASWTNQSLAEFERQIHGWTFIPAGTEGFEKAEVTAGGVDTDELSSQTMESRKISNLFFVGEVVDVTGHLGGHNFQWAWASGAAAGRAL
jgi:predicted Rossmann fold flavoprotein